MCKYYNNRHTFILLMHLIPKNKDFKLKGIEHNKQNKEDILRDQFQLIEFINYNGRDEIHQMFH